MKQKLYFSIIAVLFLSTITTIQTMERLKLRESLAKTHNRRRPKKRKAPHLSWQKVIPTSTPAQQSAQQTTSSAHTEENHAPLENKQEPTNPLAQPKYQPLTISPNSAFTPWALFKKK